MTPLAILRGARELLAKPERWTKGAMARGKSGREVSPFGKAATCFCLSGALNRAAGRDYHVQQLEKASRVLRQLIDESPTFFNDEDDTTHADILALLDRGIAQLDAATVKDSLTVRTKEPSE